jgi:PAS domain S-box-containing protein
MYLEPIRQIFRPLFGVERREIISRFLYAILISALFVDLALLVLRLLSGATLLNSSTARVLGGLVVAQLFLLFIVRKGYVTLAAVLLISLSWLGATYQVWSADGVRDSAVYLYFLLILVAALLTNWQFSIAISTISTLSIWFFAISEVRGFRLAHLDPPLHIATDLTAILILFVLVLYLVINTLRHSLDAVRQSEEKFRKIFKVSPVAIAIASLEEGRLIDANEAYWRLTGLDPKLAIGKTTVELGSWNSYAERQKFVNKLKERKSLHNSSYAMTDVSGANLTTLAFHELIDFEREPAVLSMFYDITVLKNTEEALRQSEARTRALLDAIPDMIFEFKRDGTILQYISSARNRPLLPPEQFLGKKITDVLPDSVANQTTFAIERVLDSGHVHAFEYQLFQDAENKTFEARLTPLSPDTVLAIVRDVSLQKWILGEREKLITELEVKNTELERFTYTASHDLKSPLITIKGFLGFLREDAQKGNLKRLESDIQRIAGATDKMQHLLNDLLELSRIGRVVNTSEFIDLNIMIAEVLELLHGRLSGGPILIRVSVEEHLPRVYGDRARLLEVWQNLIDNAAKFMGSQPQPHIEIGLAGDAKDGTQIFFIRDNGIGIDPRFNERIFGLFDKLDSRTDGTGIGLALVKRIIEFHGGKIWIESEPGKGATFYFNLPQAERTYLNSG